ncbi:MAG: 2-oxo acid dehydrogenase subunit E2 [Bacteroidota bacterium]
MSPSFNIVRRSRLRGLVDDALWLGRKYPMIHCLTEFDITLLRQQLKAHRKTTGERISINVFFIRAMALLAAETPEIHAIRWGNRRLAVFDQVDVFVPMELKQNGEGVLVPYLVREADRKNCKEIQSRLEQVQQSGSLPLDSLQQSFTKLPTWLRRLIYQIWMAYPPYAQRIFGTVSVSALNMGHHRGWGIGVPFHPLSLYIGSAFPLPSPTQGHMLCITLSADHRIMDGMPLVRLAKRLADCVETQRGIERILTG